MKKLVLSIAFLSSITLFGQLQMTDDSLRILFHQIINEDDIENLLSYQKDIHTNISEAYFGSATVMKAQYVFSPIQKYNNFKDGTKLLETSLKTCQTVENTYLRLLVQINTPHFLGYYEDMTEDVSFIVDNIDDCTLTEQWKVTFLEKLVFSESDINDFSTIKIKLANYKKS
tara:strand:- start:555 stop:1070 length:516 start_codon:yes stop_codon:yes gene_type:complete